MNYRVLVQSGFCSTTDVKMDCSDVIYRIVMPWANFDVFMTILYGLMATTFLMIIIKVINDLAGHRISERAYLKYGLIIATILFSILWTGTLYWYFGIPISILFNWFIMNTMNNFQKTFQKIERLNINELTDLGFFGWRVWFYKKYKNQFIELSDLERSKKLKEWTGLPKDMSKRRQRLLIFLVPFLCILTFLILNIGYIF